jgi:predicted dehydrogenase
MEQTVRWGVVGLGDVCERKSGPPLYLLPRSQLALVYRRNAAAAEEFVRRHGHGRVAESYEALLADSEVTAVYVSSPHHLHAEQSIAALEAGKHVLVEKPMALSVADCDRMIAAARSSKRSLGVAYYRRGYPSIQRVRKLLDSGAIGVPRTMSINNEFPTSHRIDLVHHLLGPVAEVATEATGHDGGGYRFEAMMPRIFLTTRTGVTVTMAEQWTETGMPEALRITGDGGTIDLSDLKGGVLAWAATGAELQTIQCAGLPWTHWGLIDNFVSHLLDGTPLLCDGPTGRESTAVLERL